MACIVNGKSDGEAETVRVKLMGTPFLKRLSAPGALPLLTRVKCVHSFNGKAPASESVTTYAASVSKRVNLMRPALPKLV